MLRICLLLMLQTGLPARRTFAEALTGNVARVPTLSARVQKIRDGMRKRLKRAAEKLRVFSAREPTYTHAQQVGFSINTLPGFTEAPGTAALKQVYHGIERATRDRHGARVDNREDARARANLMISMMNIALGSEYANKQPSVLKIFMAPEFFFRGPYGAYQMRGLRPDDNNPVYVILKMLKDEVLKPKWEHWMFVFGSIVAFARDTRQRAKYWNFAPVMFGGPANVNKHVIIRKEWVSGIDFSDCAQLAPNRARICVQNPVIQGIQHYQDIEEGYRSVLYDLGFHVHADNEFVRGSIRFGVEICLDHAQAELYRNFVYVNGTGVDLHLVVSAGMSITWSAVNQGLEAGHYRGPVFLQDGHVGAATQYLCSACDLNRFDGHGYVSSLHSRPELSDEHLVAIRRGGNVSTDFHDIQPWSPAGVATEGDGYWQDNRFERDIVRRLFAGIDVYRRPIPHSPQINFSPPQSVGNRAYRGMRYSA